MGKRKSPPHHHSLPSFSCSPSDADIMPCSSGMDLLPKEISSHSVDSNAVKPFSSAVGIMDGSVNLQDTNPSLGHQHYNLSRSIFLKRSRHYFGHQYSRRNSASHASASTSYGKNKGLRDERLFIKLASQCNSDFRYHEDTRQKAFCRPERIRSSSFITEAIPDMVKMVCTICQKLLRRKPYSLGNTPSSSDVSVVAVLVCGHVYHADCLEQRTCQEDRRDPPCPLCVGSLSKVDVSEGQE